MNSADLDRADSKQARRKVAIISAAFPPMRSGGADYALRLAQELRAYRTEVSVITTQIDGIKRQNDIEILPVMDCWSWLELPRLLRTLQKINPDIVNLHFSAWTFKDHPMISFLPEILRRFFSHSLTITHIETHVGFRKEMQAGKLASSILHGIMRTWSGSNYSSYQFGTVLKSSHRVAVLSQSNLRLLCREYSELCKKAVLTPPPAILPVAPFSEDLRQNMRSELKLESDQKLLGFFGYLYPGKGIEYLLEALKLVNSRGHKVKLILVGDLPDEYALRLAGNTSYSRTLKSLVTDLELEKYVLWQAYTESNSDLASRCLRAADFICIPFDTGAQLHRSSFSFAAAHGLPIITTIGDETEAAFVDAENVLMCPPKDSAALALCIERLLNDQSLIKTLSQGSEKMSRTWYSWEETINKSFNGLLIPERSLSLEP